MKPILQFMAAGLLPLLPTQAMASEDTQMDPLAVQTCGSKLEQMHGRGKLRYGNTECEIRQDGSVVFNLVGIDDDKLVVGPKKANGQNRDFTLTVGDAEVTNLGQDVLMGTTMDGERDIYKVNGSLSQAVSKTIPEGGKVVVAALSGLRK